MSGQFERGSVTILHPELLADVVRDRFSTWLTYDRIFVVVFAFGLYWLSSAVLQSHMACCYFGADANLYQMLDQGHVEGRLARFHPLTIGMALVWMDAFRGFVPWISPFYLLQAMFAAVGAAGVWAAMAAFASIVPRRDVAVWGLIYAVSFGIWYFSSIAESKIVTASLASIYLALYLRLREQWSLKGAMLLTAALGAACLNEIVSAFLIIVPVTEALLSRDWTWRAHRWIVAHAAVAPLAYLFLEGVINGHVIAPVAYAESGSHLRMLLFYVGLTDHSAPSLYAFALNWLFFNIAAPAQDALYAIPIWPTYRGYFEPSLAPYFFRPITVALMALSGIVAVAIMFFRKREDSPSPMRHLLWALAAYALLRAVFFFIFNPPEALLFSPGATLAHLLMVALLFNGTTLPWKRGTLIAFAAVLFLTNSAFIFLANEKSVYVPAPSPGAPARK
jgi:hypothetical protein